jgi:anti-anti-sigma factor
MIAKAELIAVDRVGPTLIVTPISDLSEFDYEPIESGASHVLSILNDPSVRNIVVDFYRTDFFGSTALGFLVRLWKRVTERKGQMALCNVSKHEVEVLRVTKLDGLWPIVDSKVKALRMIGE